MKEALKINPWNSGRALHLISHCPKSTRERWWLQKVGDKYKTQICPIIFLSYIVKFFHFHIYCLSLKSSDLASKLRMDFLQWIHAIFSRIPVVVVGGGLCRWLRTKLWCFPFLLSQRLITQVFLPFFYFLVDFFFFVIPSNNKWMLQIVVCRTIVFVKLHSLFWSSARRSFIAWLNVAEKAKIKIVPVQNVFD